MIKEFKISTSKTARYYSLGVLSRDTKNIWFVFHGYGQLARDFLSEFEVISDKRNLIVAVEALNRFYFRGFSGKVGASWMTKEARNDEIEDYILLISSIYKNIIGQKDGPSVTINVLGFSQGTHTAVRWINSSKIPVENLILWSGAFPRDVDYAENSEFWSKVKTKIVLGRTDKMIDQEISIKEIKFLRANNLDIELIDYHGGHQIDPKLLVELNKILNN